MFRNDNLDDDDDNIILLGGGGGGTGAAPNGGVLAGGLRTASSGSMRLYENEDMLGGGVPDLDSDPWDRNAFRAPQPFEYSTSSPWNQVATPSTSGPNPFSNTPSLPRITATTTTLNRQTSGQGRRLTFDDEASMEPSFGSGQPTVPSSNVVTRLSNGDPIPPPPQPPTDSQQKQPGRSIAVKTPTPSKPTRSTSSPTTNPDGIKRTPTNHFTRVASNTFGAFTSMMRRSSRDGETVRGAEQARMPLLDDDELDEDEVPHVVRQRGTAIRTEDAEEEAIVPSSDLVATWLGPSIIASILSTFCLCTLPIGLCAVFYASKVDGYAIRGRTSTARHYASVAKTLTLVCIAGTILGWGLFLLLFIELLQP
ncbi:hypothetical protein BC829DRAFT_392087 [Chytridium lagenaria]|nr:hypothetical protein BC829DRAFT_392087 [Chytridium lagenaria]